MQASTTRQTRRPPPGPKDCNTPRSRASDGSLAAHALARVNDNLNKRNTSYSSTNMQEPRTPHGTSNSTRQFDLSGSALPLEPTMIPDGLRSFLSYSISVSRGLKSVEDVESHCDELMGIFHSALSWEVDNQSEEASDSVENNVNSSGTADSIEQTSCEEESLKSTPHTSSNSLGCLETTTEEGMSELQFVQPAGQSPKRLPPSLEPSQNCYEKPIAMVEDTDLSSTGQCEREALPADMPVNSLPVNSRSEFHRAHSEGDTVWSEDIAPRTAAQLRMDHLYGPSQAKPVHFLTSSANSHESNANVTESKSSKPGSRRTPALSETIKTSAENRTDNWQHLTNASYDEASPSGSSSHVGPRSVEDIPALAVEQQNELPTSSRDGPTVEKACYYCHRRKLKCERRSTDSDRRCNICVSKSLRCGYRAPRRDRPQKGRHALVK
ncbi:hypothetical protein BV25DRAFT_1837423 [Artomyces pyxidatus]|uniref:Uncharacterized protein n=1 Tax=Artomyces pyxidatus TaxID=48021 RepID=A0ACB8T4V9_9AGAM|nr:hypothetical protein BV25DRAFT_1837423 [Artomyces pyxidatus]